MNDSDRPGYDNFRDMSEVRGPLAAEFARQIIETTRPWLPKPVEELDVLDLGSGYGHTALELAKSCRHVTGFEPSAALVEAADALRTEQKCLNATFVRGGADALVDVHAFDLIVLDNVFEHLSDQTAALRAIHRGLRPGGVVYILVPNRVWPIEVHYHLPFLSWLPLGAANSYLRWSGRGQDYEDASYAPTYWGLKRQLKAYDDWSFEFTLPGHPSATVAGAPWHYRAGMTMLSWAPSLWAISKALLVVVKKTEGSVEAH